MISQETLQLKAIELVRNMPEENVEMLVWDNEVHMCFLPSLGKLAV